MSESSAVNEPSINDFKVYVHEWLRLDEEIKTVQQTIKEKKNRMKVLDGFISKFMKSNDKDNCNVGDQNLIVLKERKTTSPVNKKHITSVLTDVFGGNAQKAAEITQLIYDQRQTKVSNYIKKEEI
jgi:hypothetical protein